MGRYQITGSLNLANLCNWSTKAIVLDGGNHAIRTLCMIICKINLKLHVSYHKNHSNYVWSFYCLFIQGYVVSYIYLCILYSSLVWCLIIIKTELSVKPWIIWMSSWKREICFSFHSQWTLGTGTLQQFIPKTFLKFIYQNRSAILYCKNRLHTVLVSTSHLYHIFSDVAERWVEWTKIPNPLFFPPRLSYFLLKGFSHHNLLSENVPILSVQEILLYQPG